MEEDNLENIERGLLSDVNNESDFIIIETPGPVVEIEVPRGDLPGGDLPRATPKPPVRKISAKVLNYLGTVKVTTSFKTRNHKALLLQSLLNELGYTLNPDGFFGQLTEAQVKKFQGEHGLKADGIVGQKTWSELIWLAQRRISNGTIKYDDYKKAADTLGVEVAVVQAIKDVEAGGSGFVFSNHPTILFESHVFWKQLDQRGIKPTQYNDPEILNQTWNQGKLHYVGGVAEHARLEKARLIHRDAASASASWGLFQIMGCNFKACGCRTIEEFVTRMCMSESEQLSLFVNFIKYHGMHTELQGSKKNWAGFAKRYNGSGYAANHYDTKLEAAYNKYK
jgi:hypothetical protein